MKNPQILLTIILAFFIVSCNDDNVIDPPAISEEEAVEVIKASMAGESAGLSENIIAFAKAFVTDISQNVQCNEATTDSYSFTNNGTVVQTAYNFNWEFNITCNNLSIPQSASFTANGSGTYNTQRIDSDDSSTFTTTVTGLQPTSSQMVYNGVFSRSGSQQMTTNQTSKNITTDFNSTVTNLTVNKSDYKVASGTGTFTLTGSNNGETFSYEGSLTFNGDNTAIVDINGKQYTIDLN